MEEADYDSHDHDHGGPMMMMRKQPLVVVVVGGVGAGEVGCVIVGQPACDVPRVFGR